MDGNQPPMRTTDAVTSIWARSHRDIGDGKPSERNGKRRTARRLGTGALRAQGICAATSPSGQPTEVWSAYEPDRLRHLDGCRPCGCALERTGAGIYQARISPDVGTPVPAVTSTCSTLSTWLTDVPRSWRTPSAMPFMPWMYASPNWPPWVLIGSRPPISIAPSAM